MAKATLQAVKPVPQNILLELTPDEARTLRYITSRVGGNPDTTRRRDSDAITAALTSVGIKYERDCEDGVASGGIVFKR